MQGVIIMSQSEFWAESGAYWGLGGIEVTGEIRGLEVPVMHEEEEGGSGGQWVGCRWDYGMVAGIYNDKVLSMSISVWMHVWGRRKNMVTGTRQFKKVRGIYWKCPFFWLECEHIPEFERSILVGPWGDLGNGIRWKQSNPETKFKSLRTLKNQIASPAQDCTSVLVLFLGVYYSQLSLIYNEQLLPWHQLLLHPTSSSSLV